MPLNHIEDRLLDMTEAQLDTFPFGIIQLDRTGRILYYNEAEAALAHRTADATIGLNFFTEVAPCTAVQAFQGRFQDFARTPGNRCEKFNFVFRFGWGDKEVGITMVRRADASERIYIVVNATTTNTG